MKSILSTPIGLRLTGRNIAYLLFIFFISLNVLPVINVSGNFTDKTVAAWDLLCMCVLILFTLRYAYHQRSFPQKPLLLLLGIIALQFSTTLFVTLETGNKEFNVVNQFTPIANVLVFYIFLGKTRLSPKDFVKFNNMYIVYALFACIYNLVKNSSNLSLFFSMNNPYEYIFSSFFENRNAFGFVLAIAIILTLINWSSGISPRKKVVYFLVTLIFSLNLLLTLSRGAFMILGIFIISYFTIKRGFIGLMKILFVVTAVITLAISTVGTDFIRNNVIRPDSGLSGRSELHEYGTSYFLTHNTFFGSGYSQPVKELSAKYNLTSYHSTYLTLLITGGILQFMFYLLLLLFALRNIVRLRKHNKNLFAFSGALLIAYLVYSSMETMPLLQLYSDNFLLSALILFIPYYLVNYYDGISGDTNHILMPVQANE